MYFLLTIGFTYFYTAFTFKPDETAEQLRKNGGYIPGIRPGRPTQDYLARVVSRITFAGALFLGIVAVSPSLVGLAFPDLRRDRSGRHVPAHRGVRRGRDDEADRSAADDEELRGIHPMTVPAMSATSGGRSGRCSLCALHTLRTSGCAHVLARAFGWARQPAAFGGLVTSAAAARRPIEPCG